MIVAFIEPILCLTIIFVLSIVNMVVIGRKKNNNS